MIKNYFKTAWRSIRKNKSFSAINLFGLSVGLAAFTLIALYIRDELRFDKFLEDRDRIYQVNLSGNFGGQELYVSNTPPPVGDALVSDFPGIETYTRVFQPGDVMISTEPTNGSAGKYFTESKVLATDSNFLQVFRFPALKGSGKEALMHPHSIVVTEAMANKYFGKTDVVGRTLLYGNDRTPFAITAVLKDIPDQSSLQFDFLVPVQSYPVVKYFTWSWVWLGVNTYVTLSPAMSSDQQGIARLESQFPDMVKRRAAKAFARIGMPMDEFFKNGGHWDFKLQPYTRAHLHSKGIDHTLLRTGNIRNLYIFGIIAMFIIILACVNFMNLSTAKSFSRAKETGVRKVMGSTRGRLVTRFLSESFLFSLLAAAAACLIVRLCLPAFNQLADKQLLFGDIFSGLLWLVLLATVIISAFLAGSYPALYLSSFKPVQVLKGKLASRGGSYYIRNILVVFQFTISVVLIICTAIVLSQMEYMQSRDLGLDKENVLIVSNNQRLEKQQETFRQLMESMDGVKAASITTNIPSGGAFGDRYIPEQTDGEPILAKDISLFSYMTDEYFVPSMNIEIKAGRNFSKDFSDSDGVILNETAVRQIGWKDPIGKYLSYPGGDYTRFKVIGVAKDFRVQSFRDLVLPFALFHHSSKTYEEPKSYLVMKVGAGQTKKVISGLEKQWKSFVPGKPLDYNFLDERIKAQYKNEQQVGRVFTVFAFLSIIVACLGLFGLAAFAAEQRTKEIGIRKVLGATVTGIVGLLSKDFVKLVIVAAIIAFPVAWWAMDQWLKDFAYRIQVSWWVFLLAGGLALVIALVTISFQAIKAAIANPVSVLRSE